MPTPALVSSLIFSQIPQCRVAAAAVRVDDHGCRAVEDAFVRGPAVGNHGGLEAEAGFLHLVGKERGAGAVLVLAGPVAGLSGDEDDLAGLGFGLFLCDGSDPEDGADEADEDCEDEGFELFQ